MAAAGSAGGAASPGGHSNADCIFEYDRAKAQSLIDKATRIQFGSHPTEDEVKMFSKCKVSALAAMKMLKHALKGVKKGHSSGELSREVMGLLIGKPEGNTVVVMDCVALPVEGEANFVSSSDKIQGLQAEMVDSLELRREDRFVGWYHSHPFDVEEHDHCFLSVTDVQTQQSYQSNSAPWTAIVVDPLRSVAKAKPVLGCFRTYPIKYEPPKGQGPDGKDDNLRNWGPTPNRYYQLDHEFFMSGASQQLVEIMSRNNLWVRVLSSSLEPESRKALPDRLEKAGSKVRSQIADRQSVMGNRRRHQEFKEQVGQQLSEVQGLIAEAPKGQAPSMSALLSSSVAAAAPANTVLSGDHQQQLLVHPELSDGNNLASEACLELLASQTGQLVKNLLFNVEQPGAQPSPAHP